MDEFVSETEKDNNLSPELGDLYAVLEDIANRKPHPKYKKLHLSDHLIFAGYEIKSRHLRVYLFHEKGTGQILVFGGKKTDQVQDLKRFQKIIREYALFKNLQT